jgi:hypothetical protein
MEIWKDIKGFEGRYQVSNTGKVKSLRFLGHDGERLMKLSPHHSGYLIVQLGKHPAKTYHVHFLVASAFLPSVDGKPIVNHIDGNKHNNHVDNLEWVTYKENTEHAIKTGLRNPHDTPKRFGKNNPQSKPVLQYDLSGNFIRKWDSQSDVARAFNAKSSTVSACIDNPSLTFRGYMFRSFSETIESKIQPCASRLLPKPVNQYDMNGNFISEWDNAKDASKYLCIPFKGIMDCCYGRQKSCGGYIWKLK